MSDARTSSTPVLNSVLTLKKEPARREAPGGGKKEADIVSDRLNQQRVALDRDLSVIMNAISPATTFAGQLLIVAEMFDDSFAISKSPKDLFLGESGTLVASAAHNGYLIEANEKDLQTVRRRIRAGQSIPVRCDISRVRAIRSYSAVDILGNRSAREIWNEAVTTAAGKRFHVWLSPYQQEAARNELIQRVAGLSARQIMLPTQPSVLLERRGTSETAAFDQSERQNSLAIAQRAYRQKGHARLVVDVRDSRALATLVASGGAFRIDPVRPISVAAPGGGAEPGALPADIGLQPVVGLVDGPCTAQRYRQAEAWREPSLVPMPGYTRHGNQVASVVIQGHEWNNNLNLPYLYCRFGGAAVLPQPNTPFDYDPDRLVAYLDAVMARHQDTRVWNLSWNEGVSVDPQRVSALGHSLATLARKHHALFVISAGNVSNTQGDRVAPPADCESALVIGGRSFNNEGVPSHRCPESLPGHGPEMQLLPHVTSYSPLRLIGGVVSRGTSYPTGLISALAAHTFENLRDPTPDLVRALIVEKTDLQAFDIGLGWGTPCHENMPWVCSPGTVSLTFRANLKPGILYYWQDIPIPRELVRNGKLFGSASITTVHRPLCNEEGGPSYFSSRVAAAIQYPDNKGEYKRLVGSQENDTTDEMTARAEEFKWQPFRRDSRQFNKRGGIGFNGDSFRIYARAYGRNIKQFGYNANADIPELETIFVVTFSDGTSNSRLYNALSTSLGNYVESAVIDQDIEVDR